MLDIGWSELLLLGVVILVAVAPQDLPRLLRTAGRFFAYIRNTARDFQFQIENAPDQKPKRRKSDRQKV